MKKALQKLLTSVFVFVIALMALPNGTVKAQYCGYESAIYLYNYAIIKRVTITDMTEGNDIYERNSDWDNNGWATVDVTGTSSNPIELNIGNNFEITVNWGLYYQGYLRVYIDKNIDGRWETTEIGPDKEFLCNILTYDYNYYIPPIAFNDVKIPFTIGDDVPEGPSRIRVIANYGYYTTDPCISYANTSYIVGEIEDYAVNFVAAIPEVYPTDGNILYNKERYDGTTRNYKGVSTQFKLPAVEFKGAQPVGTSIEYSIFGPLPSNEVVYKALDPKNGSSIIKFNSPTQTYNMQSATGSASVSINEGTFLPSKGGEYKTVVKVTKPNGKSSEGIKVFTVANDFDMQVSSVVSPRTNRAPRFFKYLRSTNISVACQVQNTGLNNVNRFEVTAKIYNANTNVLVSNLPKLIFDSDNDPSLMPLAPGQKYEANFAAFKTAFIGEYYVEFEVSYTYDEENYNNYLPRPDGEKHFFEVQYNDQLTAGDFEYPLNGTILKVNKPAAPRVLFFNNGISDASNINLHMIVKDESGSEVYNEVSFLEDLPQGRYNSKVVQFPNLVIGKPGSYTACSWVDYPYDLNHDDDTTCIEFQVELGIQDTITVGDIGGFSENNEDYNYLNSVFDNNVPHRIESLVADFKFNGFTVNPASNSTDIKFESKEALNLEVVDLNGNVVISAIAENNLHKLDVSKLTSGAYTVILRSPRGIQSRQLSVFR